MGVIVWAQEQGARSTLRGRMVAVGEAAINRAGLANAQVALSAGGSGGLVQSLLAPSTLYPSQAGPTGTLPTPLNGRRAGNYCGLTRRPAKACGDRRSSRTPRDVSLV